MEVISSLVILKYKFSYHSSYFDFIVKTIKDWDTLNVSAKQKAIHYTFMFLMQSDPQSKLANWFRSQSNSVMLNKIQSAAQKIVSFKKINEDEGGGEAVSTGNIASNAIVNPGGSDGDTSSSHDQDLGGLFKLVKRSPYQVSKKSGKYNIRNGKVVVKRAKNFNPKKFKAPDFLKVKKTEKPEGKKEIENEVK